jgi:integrase
MAKVVAYIRSSNQAKSASVRFRLTDRKFDISHTSEFEIHPNHFDKILQGYSSKVNVSDKVKLDFNRKIFDRKELLIELYNAADKSVKLTSSWFNKKVAERMAEVATTQAPAIAVQDVEPKPRQIKSDEQLLIDTFAEFIDKYKISDVRKKNYKVILRTLQRYELYACFGKEVKRIFLTDITTDKLSQIEYFFKNECVLATDYPKLYENVPETRQPKPRGDNTISDMMTKLRTYFIWCYKNRYIQFNPFANFKIKSCVYGSPIYISLEELNAIYTTDLSNRPALLVQRDIFVFHSLIGCRVSDLHKLTWQNVIGDTITYIPNKTKHLRSNAIVVPLNNTSRAILQKYKGGDKLLPFISQQKYNKAIKEIFKLAGITRKVIVLNTLTGKEELVPINSIASSHMCRRNMVGNLYNKVQDTAVIGAITGHSPNSRAFARYRNIENQVKKSAIDQLNLDK